MKQANKKCIKLIYLTHLDSVEQESILDWDVILNVNLLTEYQYLRIKRGFFLSMSHVSQLRAGRKCNFWKSMMNI